MIEVDALCRIEMLGGLRARTGDREITRFRTQKAGGLLAYLAYHRDRSHPREVLIELLWPWTTPGAGRHSLSVELSALRHQLEPPGVPTRAVIQADRTSVRLNAESVTTDVADFEAALASAERAIGDADRTQCLVDAVEAYRGPLLPGYYQEWILPEQERLAALYIGATHALTTSLGEAGDYERAIEYARRAVGAERLREEVHRNLIGLLAAAGQIEAALHQYEELEQILADEFGEAPSPATRGLAERLTALRDDPEARVEPPLLPAMPAPAPKPGTLPTGTVTLLLAEVERPTMLGEETDQTLEEAVAECYDLLRRDLERCGGQEVGQSSDSLTCVLGRASDALSCAIACQQASMAHPEVEGAGQLRARMALDTGEVTLASGRYRGTVVDRARGLLLAAHGGQVLCSETAASVLRTELPPDMALADLGYYRLRTIEVPERLFAVEYPGVTAESFPPPKAAFAYRSNLPPQFTRFFGREDELIHLRQLLLADETRLVTLTGPGGSGKTRLAIEAAQELSGAFRGAVWFVALQELTDAGPIAGMVVDALDLKRPPEVEPLDQACEALSRQPSLLVFDNFEQLVEGGAPIVQSVLERAPTVKCLVTSRQRLDVSAERELQVDPLPTPADETSPDELARCASVQVFVDRAQAVRPDFQITEGNARAIGALCAHLEGIPLALELAAARAQVMTPARMLEQMESRFGFLVSRRRDVTERHRSLRAALDWSYELLRAELQRFFAGLSVFRGGWTVEAAKAVCEEPAALECLEQLWEASFVLASGPAGGAAEMRFGMLETLREYGWERLPDKERAALVQRHTDYFLALAEESEGYLERPDLAEWLDRLEAEHQNLRAVLLRLRSDPGATERGLRLAAILSPFWQIRGYLREARDHLGHFLDRSDAPAYPRLRAPALSTAASVSGELNEREEARALREAALAIWRELGDGRQVAFGLAVLGNLAFNAWDSELAETRYRESLDVSRRIGYDSGVAGALEGIAGVAYRRGDLETARDLWMKVVEMHESQGDVRNSLGARISLAQVAAEQGSPAEYVRLLRESKRAYESQGYRRRVAGVLSALADVHLASARTAEARGCLEEALTLVRELQDTRAVASTTRALAAVARLQGDLDAAHSFSEECLRLAREAADDMLRAHALCGLGLTALCRGDCHEARERLRRSLETARKLEQPPTVASCLHAFAELLSTEGRHVKAARLIGAAERICAQPGIPHLWIPHRDCDHERAIAAARAGLSNDAFEAARAEGRAMDCDEAVAYALKAPTG